MCNKNHGVRTGRHAISGMLLLAGSISANAQIAQDVEKLPTMEVIGSRLNLAELEAALPLTTISRDDIEHSGQISLAGVLRSQTTNSFGSFTPTSGTGAAQGGAQVNLRGLGAQRTLVLIDGRRMPNNPAFAGAAQNINVIPLEMIERIEILRDGASAIYGSDAIGGVINLITRKNYDGNQFRAQFESPEGNVGNASTAAFSGGASSDAGQLYYGLEYYDKGIIHNRDRSVSRDIGSAAGYPGTIYEYDTQGNVVPQPSNPDASGKPRNFRPFDDCPMQGFGSSADHPDSNQIDGVCRYSFGRSNGLTAALRRLSLNLGGRYRMGSNTSAFGHLIVTGARSVGESPPAAVDTVVDGVRAPDANGGIGIRMSPDNPDNPDPGSTLVINYRATALGPRKLVVDDRIHQTLLGLRGNIGAGIFNDWEIAASFNDYRQRSSGRNNGLASRLQAAVDDGSFNPFAPTPAAADAFRYTTSSNNHFTAAGIDGHIRTSLKLGGLELSSVWGMEYRHADFAVISDAQSSQSVTFAADGSINGFRKSNVLQATGGSAAGGRSYAAAFMEAAMQLPDQKLELGLALRFDRYSDAGGNLSPKFSLGYRPHETLLLRGSYGAGFRAPDLGSMYGAPNQSYALVLDRLACSDHSGDAASCSNNVQRAIYDSNPELKPEKSLNLSTGLVWSPAPRLSLAMDYYAIKINGAITQLAPQTVLDNELRCADAGRRCDARREGYAVRNEAAGLLFVYSPAVNAAVLQTRGIDLTASYSFNTPGHGQYKLGANFERTLSYKRKDNDIAPLLERLDSLNAGGDIFPRFRFNATLAWMQGRYSATLTGNYVSKVTDCDAPDRLARRAACNNSFGDYRTVDLQLGYETPWKQSIALGARNLFNEAPQVSRYVRSATLPGVFLALHDSDQRVLYLRFLQRF